MNLTELLGHAASIMIVVSLLMHNVVKLRVINLIGCTLFVFYGVAIDASPVWLMNATAALINVYYLYKMFKRK